MLELEEGELPGLSKSVEKAKLPYDYEFSMPLLGDVLRVARGLLKDTEPTLPPLK
ncbi:MAG: hypothetical protein ACREEI_12460 [Stellaceae bacterium]